MVALLQREEEGRQTDEDGGQNGSLSLGQFSVCVTITR